MKSIYLIRHSDAGGGLSDIDRPLTQNGLNHCAQMAPKLTAAGCDFDTTFVSPAVRAQQTIQQLANSLTGSPIEWSTDDMLYTFEWPILLGWLENVDDRHDTITVVGHNPAVSEVAHFLTGADIGQVPPCTCIHISAFVANWRDLYRECGQLMASLYPVE
ncbi:MAG: histidine phosphatase family protein [Pseudomonadota bacterium]